MIAPAALLVLAGAMLALAWYIFTHPAPIDPRAAALVRLSADVKRRKALLAAPKTRGPDGRFVKKVR